MGRKQTSDAEVGNRQGQGFKAGIAVKPKRRNKAAFPKVFKPLATRTGAKVMQSASSPVNSRAEPQPCPIRMQRLDQVIIHMIHFEGSK